MADANLSMACADVVLDAQGRIGHDVHCIQCGYNLRGLLVEQVCPECGTDVRMSLRPDFLHFAKPEWVETLASGMNWLVVGLVLIFLTSCFGPVTLAFVALKGSFIGAAEWVMIALHCAMVAIILLGCWRLTTPDGRELDLAHWSARKVARFFVTTSGLLSVSSYLLLMLPTLFSSSSWLSFGVTLLWIIGYFSIGRYLIQLAQRIPNPRFVLHTRICRWGMGGAILVTAISNLWFSLVIRRWAMGVAGTGGGGAPTTPPPEMEFLTIARMLAMVFMLIFGLWNLILIGRYRGAFAKAAKQARASWAAEAVALMGPRNSA